MKYYCNYCDTTFEVITKDGYKRIECCPFCQESLISIIPIFTDKKLKEIYKNLMQELYETDSIKISETK